MSSALIMDAWRNLDARSMMLASSGLCLAATFHITSQHALHHFHHWTRPREQTAILWIIAMVPLFSLTSYVGLVEMPTWEVTVTILDSVKECYEAFVIANFLKLLFSYMGVSPDAKVPIPDEIKGRVFHHSFPVTLFQPHEVIISSESLQTLTKFTTQFVVIRPLFSVLLCVLELLGVNAPPLSWVFPVVFNASVYLAIYALLLFYHTFDKELAPHNPLGKFLCIKGVVFFTFWQGMVIELLAASGVLHADQFPFSVKQVEDAVQNFAVCIEMLVFSFAFLYAFSAEEFSPSYKPKIAAEKKKEKEEKIDGKKEEKNEKEGEKKEIENKKEL